MTMILPNGTTPRGLCSNGTVRTTGWLQIGRVPISSGFWAVLAGFFAPLPLQTGWLPWLCAILAYVAWKMWTLTIHPSSKAVNIKLGPAAELVPGEWIRLHGSAGPIAEVEALEFDPTNALHVWLAGGRELFLAPHHLLWRAEPRN